MPADRTIPQAPRSPLLAALAWSARRIGLGALLLAAGLALAPARTLAADPHAKVIRPPNNVQANAARSSLLKQRSAVLGVAPKHAGKLVGGTATPPARTVVTKRILPK